MTTAIYLDKKAVHLGMRVLFSRQDETKVVMRREEVVRRGENHDFTKSAVVLTT